MLNAPRWLLALVSIAFGLYHALLGALAWRSFDSAWILALSIFIYLISLTVSVVASKGLAIGRLYGLVVALGAIATVVVSNQGIHRGHTDPYSTWYVGGMAALLGVLAARGQSLLAWAAAGVVAWQVALEVGVGGLPEVGLEGIAILIAAASATAFALKRADREVSELQQTEVAAEAGIASAEAASEERRTRLNQVLERALPALSYIAANRGHISEEQQEKLLQLEASLRDEIRGRSLVNDVVRQAASAARSRGVEVVVMDEGGLNELDESKREHILNKIATAIDSVQAGKIVIRSPRGEKWLVTVMATRPGTSAPDLWLKF
jgi:hypothetical protein